ncbi:hypothetical protein C1H57_12605 [Clostridium sp. 2-1]|uniref:hypothetical protein n=1 Tax=Clostridium TaxID=1485 RepID=UPI000CDAD8E2|nr:MULTISPECIES: hypothetical protein [Clostridium]MBN7575993.1 hypothetical protein [Clostridium beijerinckii]MBN7581174.1 hypothetical protein [Clostridium beijerinckii]MBN7585714.1 hypothetical protein [Clostridium beijerinckii]MBO0521503.1 hypothetical protein [Clostridium beijerinckii]POO91020.1 hypothetical protein C1H57_12605 [Clostridium sp. 2-1]
MANLVGIVNKPQFDVDTFTVGKAIHVKQWAKSNGYKIKDLDGLIKEIDPLRIHIWLFNEGDDDCDYIVITISEVVSEEYELTLMQEVK